MINVGVIGSKGRVGSRLVALIRESQDLKLCLEIDLDSDISQSLERVKSADVLIDFTAASVTAEWLKRFMESSLNPSMVIGSTGWTEENSVVLKKYTETAAVMQENNMSVGANLLFEITQYASNLLKDDADLDIEIVETHHKYKKDAPSGTAFRIFESVKRGLGRNMKAITDRSSMNRAREKDEIGIQALRGGDVIGEHTVSFFKNGEVLEFTHRASNRDLFANGALSATRWLIDKTPGLYSMKDVLNIENSK